MARFLVQRDGLFLGSSSAVNLVACVKLVRKMGWGNGEKVVTVLYVFPSPARPHCLDANDAVNLSRDARVKLISSCDSGARHYSKVRLPSPWARPPCLLGANRNQKKTLNLTTVLVRSSLFEYSVAIFAKPHNHD